MLVPNRNYQSPEYRYGFNGMEKDDNIKGNNNSYDFGARMYDPRVGRWSKLDNAQSQLPYLTPYGFVNNNPLRFVDPDGNFLIDVHQRITNNSFVKWDYTKLNKKVKQELSSYKLGLTGHGMSSYMGSVVASDVDSLPWYLGGTPFPNGPKSSNHKDHFDNMDYGEILSNFEETFENLDDAICKYNSDEINIKGLSDTVGREFHAIQDFYSHSNFIEIYKDVYGETDLSEIPTLQEAMSQDKYKDFAKKLKKKLKTGTYPGKGKDSHKGMNHDLGKGSKFGKIVPEVKGKKVDWNSRAAEAVATKATKEVNEKVETAIVEKNSN